jgi:hypothetical protein
MLETKIFLCKKELPFTYRFHQNTSSLRYVMSDLTLQDFRDFFSERLDQVLSDEKKKMFGEQKFHVEEREENRLCSIAFAGSFAGARKDGT